MTIPAFFFDLLAAHGDRVALETDTGSAVSYLDLAARCDAFASRLQQPGGPQRGLLLIEMTNTPAAVVAYLGALRARWPAILTAPGRGADGSDLVTRFAPDLILAADGVLRHGPGSSEALHPDLGVMLSTSGSTGSTKLVRLSHRNLHENARSIAEYLELDPERTAVTTLPMHYSYGLSVLNSFLLAGGRVTLTEASVIDPGFRPLLDRAKVTDLAGVPYTYELFERVGLRDNPPPTLRAMTQAGGRLPPDLVARYAEFARDRRFRFFVMYGQTEATARMAYLPPEQALANPDCIGVPIPRGEFRLRAEDGAEITASGVAGELIYRGPNVMMGYALARADLARGPELKELATGDIAERLPNGFFRIVGRMSRFAKIAGLRIGFDEVERMLREAGFAAQVTGNDQALLLALPGGDPAAAAELVSARCGIPATSVFAWVQAELPRLASGKIDAVTLRATGLALLAERRRQGGRQLTVAGLFARALNRNSVSPDESFSSLGGDSLAYVAASVGVEELLGTTPVGWETLPIRELQARADAFAREQRALPANLRQRSLTIGTDVLLRLMAISLVFLGHGYPEGTTMLRGGANVLFALAGYSMMMIHHQPLLDGKVRPFLRGAFLRLVLPYLLIVAVLLPITNTPAKSLSWFTFSSTVFLDWHQRGLFYSFWFIEVLIQSMVLTSLLLLIPKFRDCLRRQGFAASIILATLAFAAEVAGRRYWPNGAEETNLTLDAWLYMFFLGWAVFFASTRRQRLWLVAMTAALAFSQYGLAIGRPYWLTAACATLVTWRTLQLGRRLSWALVHITSATYFMYMCHPIVIQLLRNTFRETLPPALFMALVLAASAATGVVAAGVWARFLRVLRASVPGSPALPIR